MQPTTTPNPPVRDSGEGPSHPNPNQTNSSPTQADQDVLCHQQEVEAACLAKAPVGSSQVPSHPDPNVFTPLDFSLSDEDDTHMDIDQDSQVLIHNLQAIVTENEVKLKQLTISGGTILVEFNKRINATSGQERAKLISQRNDTLIPITQQSDQCQADMDMALSTLKHLVPSELTKQVNVVSAFDHSDPSNVTPNPNVDLHHSLAYWGPFKTIPVFPGTDEVDFDRVMLKTYMDLPILDLTKHLHHVKKADFEVELVKGIYQFIATFSKSLQDKLTDLFDFLAWCYLPTALKIIDMDNDFHEHMKRLPWAEQNWASAESCLCKLFCLDAISGNILESVFSFKSISQEEMADFVRRFNTLIWAASIVDSAGEPNMPHCYLIEVPFWAVPSSGQQVILTHFKDLSAIQDYHKLI